MSRFYRLCDTEHRLVVFTMYIQKILHRPRVCVSAFAISFLARTTAFPSGCNFFPKNWLPPIPIGPTIGFGFHETPQQWSIINGIVPWQISVCVLSEKTIVSSSFLGRRMERSLWEWCRDATTDDYFIRHFIHIARLRCAVIYFVCRCNSDSRPFYCCTLLGAFVIDKRWYHVERRPGEEIQRFDIFWK